jgi:hypothetical protein
MRLMGCQLRRMLQSDSVYIIFQHVDVVFILALAFQVVGAQLVRENIHPPPGQSAERDWCTGSQPPS